MPKYYIIEKMEAVDGEIVKTNIGYAADGVDMSKMFETHYIHYNWILSNIDGLEDGTVKLVDYLIEQGGVVYTAPFNTDVVEGMGLDLIPDIYNIGGE